MSSTEKFSNFHVAHIVFKLCSYCLLIIVFMNVLSFLFFAFFVYAFKIIPFMLTISNSDFHPLVYSAGQLAWWYAVLAPQESLLAG